MKDNKTLSYWNSLYSTENFFGAGPTKLAKIATEHLNKKNLTILEVGCGQGRDAIFLSSLGHNVHAFDISESAVNYVKKLKISMQLQNLNIFTHDIENPLSFPNDSFDFVYSNLALQFFDSTKLQQIFTNISKVIKKNSLFLFSTKKIGDKYYNFGKKINEHAYEYKGITRYFYPEHELKNLLSTNYEIIFFDDDSHSNLDSTISVWWKILVRKK
ncbi:MAG TPA: class I SAM-dependent methyltransferase [Nitrososphaeraceae archaeon]|nr:class I SAM-dependent methyltransferase [Nitrososphaeraceae archaeon]